MPSGDIMRASVEGRFGGEPVMFDLGFVSQSGAADFASDADQLDTEISAALDLGTPTGVFMGPLAASYTLENIRIQDLSPGVAAGRAYGLTNLGGNAVDDALPPAVALCVTWRTGLKGKQNMGRTYLTGFAEDSQVAGYWIGEIQGWAAAAFASPLLAAFGPLGTGNYSLSVIHTVAGGVRLTPPTATPIESFTVHNEVRTLRKRGIGVHISRHRSTP